MGILTAIDPTGNTIGQPRAVAPGESVAAAETQRLRLTIRDRHTITIDPGTRLTANRTGDGGCTIALSTGQITASVRRAEGEGVFRVTTPHAELIVTGTVFTVGATLDNTRLSVREGTVQLARPDRPAITVAAGQEYSTHGDVLVRLDGDERLLALADELKDPVAAAGCVFAGTGARGGVGRNDAGGRAPDACRRRLVSDRRRPLLRSDGE